MSKYFGILTTAGTAAITNALGLGVPVNITELAVGDGGGNEVTPDETQTTLVNEVYRAQINTLTVDPNNPSVIILEMVIPESTGGFWIREMGAWDDNGVLLAVCNVPPNYKAQLDEGSGGELVLRMSLVVSNVTAITLKIDPSIVLATREYVDDAIDGLSKDFLKQTNNLSDVGDAAEARKNLGIDDVLNDMAGEFLQSGNNLSDLTDVPAARKNLGIGAIGELDDLPGRLLKVQVFTESGPWTPTEGTHRIEVELQGPGAAGGTLSDTAGYGISGGGGAGAWLLAWTDDPDIISAGNVQVMVGAPNGACKFGSWLNVPTGVPGGTVGGQTYENLHSTGIYGQAPTADEGWQVIAAYTGERGGDGWALNTALSYPGEGASSRYGAGGRLLMVDDNAGHGTDGRGYGAGGSGYHSKTNTETPGVSGAGTPGLVIVREYS